MTNIDNYETNRAPSVMLTNSSDVAKIGVDVK
jgi:hypothetical protein